MSDAQFTLVPSIRSKYWKDLPIGDRVRIAGTASSFTRETGAKGAYSIFSGKFVCAVQNGKTASAVKLMLPKFADDVLRQALDEALSHDATEVEFGFEMVKVEDKSSIAGYVWEINSLGEPVVPTDRFKSLVDFGSKPEIAHASRTKGKNEVVK